MPQLVGKVIFFKFDDKLALPFGLIPSRAVRNYSSCVARQSHVRSGLV